VNFFEGFKTRKMKKFLVTQLVTALFALLQAGYECLDEASLITPEVISG
jgi:hypothetical protein